MPPPFGRMPWAWSTVNAGVSGLILCERTRRTSSFLRCGHVNSSFHGSGPVRTNSMFRNLTRPFGSNALRTVEVMAAPDIPGIKRAGLPVDFDRLAAEGDDWLTPEDRYALKPWGVCAQTQD